MHDLGMNSRFAFLFYWRGGVKSFRSVHRTSKQVKVCDEFHKFCFRFLEIIKHVPNRSMCIRSMRSTFVFNRLIFQLG